MKKILKEGIFVFTILCLLSSRALAFDFQIDKPKVRVNLPPGWSDGSIIRVDNRDDEPVSIRVYVSDWVYTDQDGSKAFMPPGTHPMSAAEWVKFYPADFTIPGNGSQELKYVVGVPPDAVGGHYAVLFFEVGAGDMWDEVKGVMVKVYNRLGSLFYIEPEGTIIREAHVTDFKMKGSPEGFEAEAVFHNIGNVDIDTKGTLDIIDEEGFVFSRASFNQVYTMQQDKAKLLVRVKDANFSRGRYDVILTFDLNGGILVKEYQIEVSGSGSIVAVKELGQSF
ncbi:hypothetical protein ACFL2Y_04465 [Candidatus Omnitrophota bacterium]